jgi:lipoic acid synthetase
MRQYPAWLRQEFSAARTAREVHDLVGDLALTTVCQSALCPNLAECWSQRQLTFMILGGRCTRTCRFCAVDAGRPAPPAPEEPWRVAEAVRRLGLRHAVITSVARDDLADEGADHFVRVIDAVRGLNPGVTVEVLVPDFHGREELIGRILEEGQPEVFAHNVETVARLSALVRPQASYARSLQVLRTAAARGTPSRIKSSLMVGLGETEAEVQQTLEDLVAAGTTHLTIGQYLRPDAGHLPVMEYVSPARFERYAGLARQAGLVWVSAGPFVRSSYHAVDALRAETAARGR